MMVTIEGIPVLMASFLVGGITFIMIRNALYLHKFNKKNKEGK